MAESPQDTPPLDNPVIKPDSEGDRLEALARKVDVEGYDPSVDGSAQPESAPRAADGIETEKQPESQSTSSEASVEPARDELGRFTKADGTKSEPGEVAPAADEKPADTKPAKSETPYEKAKKDAERLARNRREFEEEKARERAVIQAERQRIEMERQQLQQAAQTPQGQFTSKAYDDAAASFERQAEKDKADGDVDSAANNFDLARKARVAAAQVREQEHQQQFAQQKGGFEQVWRQNMEATIKEVPEIADPNSPLGLKLQELFKREPVFNYVADGFKKAVSIVMLQEKAAKASELEEKLKQTTAELSKYVQRTAIGGSSPTSHSGSSKKFEDMTSSEMERFLERQAQVAGGIAA